jgi:uncharacterized protein YhjY with autotransporter beta-barrel domain
MNMKATFCLALFSATALFCTPVAAQETTLTFDDLPAVSGQDSGLIPNGYGGLDWNNEYYLNGAAYPGTGYDTGMVSTPHVAFDGSGAPSSFSSTAAINVVSVELTSAFAATNHVTFTAYDGATLKYTLTLTVSNSGPTLEALNFLNVTSVDMVSTLGNFGEWWVLDDLIIGSSHTSFASIAGLDDNQRGTASILDAASAGSGSAISHIVTALNSLPLTEVAGALDQLAPTKFNQFASSTAFNNASFDVADMDNYLDGERTGPNGTFVGGNGQVDTHNFVINDPNVDPGLQMIHSRMLAWNDLPGTISDVPGAVLGGVDMKEVKPQCTACAASSPWNVFLRGNVILAQDFSQADVPHSDNNTVSVTAGADYRISDHVLVGLTASYAHTDATLDDFGSSATVDSYSPGFYASYADGGWFANFIGRYSYNTYTDNRNIAFLGQTANGATTGNEGMVDLDGGYLFHSGPWSYGPVAGVQYTHLTVNSYAEQDSDANLNVDEDQSDSLRSRLGGEVRYNTCGCGVTFSPHLTATWQHEFMDQSRGVTSQFTQFSGGSFTVRTDDPSRDSALVDLGLDAKVNNAITVFGDYVVQAGQDNYFGQSLQAGVRVNF